MKRFWCTAYVLLLWLTHDESATSSLAAMRVPSCLVVRRTIASDVVSWSSVRVGLAVRTVVIHTVMHWESELTSVVGPSLTQPCPHAGPCQTAQEASKRQKVAHGAEDPDADVGAAGTWLRLFQHRFPCDLRLARCRPCWVSGGLFMCSPGAGSGIGEPTSASAAAVTAGPAGAADASAAAPSSLIIQFQSTTKETTGPQVEVPFGTTTDQLEQILNSLLTSDGERKPYSFYVNDKEIVDSVGASVTSEVRGCRRVALPTTAAMSWSGLVSFVIGPDVCACACACGWLVGLVCVLLSRGVHRNCLPRWCCRWCTSRWPCSVSCRSPAALTPCPVTPTPCCTCRFHLTAPSWRLAAATAP